MKVKGESEVLSGVQLLATPWTAAYQAPPSMGFSRQEYWSEVPLPPPEVTLYNCNFTLDLVKFLKGQYEYSCMYTQKYFKIFKIMFE